MVSGFCESGRRLAEEKGRFVKGRCCGADGGAAGKERKWKQRGWSCFFKLGGGKGKGRLCGDNEKEEGVEVGGERPVFCLAKWGRSTALKEMDFWG